LKPASFPAPHSIPRKAEAQDSRVDRPLRCSPQNVPYRHCLLQVKQN
jgi:hypothetical protein